MSTDPQDGTEPPAGGTDPQPPRDQGPAYYRPGPSSGYYPQYPQNPYGPGRPGVPPQFSGTQPGQNQYGQTQEYGRTPEPGRPGGPTYPYGGPYSADSGSFGAAPLAAGRPRSVVTALVLLLVPPALFLLFGLVFALGPLTPELFPPESGVDAALAQSGLTMEQFLSALRTFGFVVAALAVVYAVLAVVSFLGKLGALITLTVLTVLFDLFLLFTLLSVAANPVGAIVPVIVLGCSVAGVWLMFTPPARAWFAARR